jgi:excisionase family DNA binding protein
MTRRTDAALESRPQLITTKDAAELLSVSQSTVQNWVDRGVVPYVELPRDTASARRQIRIPLGALLQSLSGNYDLAAELREGRSVAGEIRALDTEAPPFEGREDELPEAIE